MTLENVERFVVPGTVVADTEDALREAGTSGYELFVLWTGAVEGDRFRARTMHVPKQTSYRHKRGLLVRVEGDALHDLNKWLYEHRQVLAVQVHAHPRKAFHSDTDDEFPIVTARGGLSIVVADFCRDGLISMRTAYFRLLDGEWQEQTSSILEVD
ncbi:MAG: hypothetical protein M3546_11215 [Actinomycetota bacterium]|nr:hypothetical protein [Actinomycetota bacterium]